MSKHLIAAAALLGAALALGGCYYPGYYGYGYGGGYYAPGYAYGGPSIVVGRGWGGGWRDRR